MRTTSRMRLLEADRPCSDFSTRCLPTLWFLARQCEVTGTHLYLENCSHALLHPLVGACLRVPLGPFYGRH